MESTRITRKGHSNTHISAPPPTMVVGGEQCAPRSTITPTKTCSADLYRRIKRRVGCSLKRAHCHRFLVTTRKQAAYKLELEAVFLALKEFQDLCSDKIVLVATDNTTVVSYINKEGGRRFATAVDALSLRWENLDAYAFPPAAILGKVVEKLQDSPCKRIILIAPGWPNMLWFWYLVTMSSQIPLSLPVLPNLLTQPFNQIPPRNLANLNLHEPQESRSRDSLRQWQQELRLLKEDQPDQSMRQSGPFLQSGASLMRWTSGHPL